jgi:hypothetical protein
MRTVTRTNSKIKCAELGPLVPFAQAIAAMVVDEIRPLLEGRVGDEWYTRETCPYSKRWWDRNAGKTFDVYKDGRQNKGKKPAVDLAFERDAKLAPKAATSIESLDEDEAELARAGIRLVGSDR